MKSACTLWNIIIIFFFYKIKFPSDETPVRIRRIACFLLADHTFAAYLTRISFVFLGTYD